MSKNKRSAIQAVFLCVAAILLICGINRGEAAVILNKAVNVCLECIGLG